MNIIFYRYNSICEPDYIDAFSRLGIDVREDMDGFDQKMSVSEKMTRLGNMISDNRPLFIFSINFFPFLSILCERLGVFYLAESVDCPVYQIYHPSIRNKMNRVFLFDRQQYLSVKNENPGGVFYLPLGAPCERVAVLLGDSYEDKYDISFVGSLYNEKDPFLDLKLDEKSRKHYEDIIREQFNKTASGLEKIASDLKSEDINVIRDASDSFIKYEDGVIDMDSYVVINDYIASHMAFLERIDILNDLADTIKGFSVHLFTGSTTKELSKNVRVHGVAKSYTEMPVIFRNSKINLNMTMRGIQTGLPQRIWDVLACRGFLLTNDQSEITDYFIPGVHLETYSSRCEMKEKITYYLEHDEERIKIAKSGYEEVCSKHTITLRVMEMIRTVVG
ncbi:glycosyltransferase family protein [Butyrivibrio sp. YAB3001]|uniref:glycosyltransferase family protein n=1 Tax=Butyrivibrio sp. YAB3001 TaxID=1520812 RepID=UPI00158817F1|nr:glycosyltransferase [Butyrivibrio sp. YAB3001]